MTTISLQDVDAIAEAVALKQVRYNAPVLTIREAGSYVGCCSAKSFHRWREKWSVPMCSDGRYARRELDAGMKRESRNRYERKAS